MASFSELELTTCLDFPLLSQALGADTSSHILESPGSTQNSDMQAAVSVKKLRACCGQISALVVVETQGILLQGWPWGQGVRLTGCLRETS